MAVPLKTNLRREKWESLDAEYGLTDMFEESSETRNGMTIGEEYGAYVNAPLSSKGTPLLKFWEVCDYLL